MISGAATLADFIFGGAIRVTSHGFLAENLRSDLQWPLVVPNDCLAEGIVLRAQTFCRVKI